MTTSDNVAAISGCAALLSALFAYWTLTQAKRQNEIGLQSERLKIYRGFLDFNFELSQYATDIKEPSFKKLDDSVRLSEFYFDEPLYKLMQEFSKNADRILISRMMWETEKDNKEKYAQKVDETYSFLNKCKELFPKIDEAFRERLRLFKK